MTTKTRPNRPHGYEKKRSETPEHVASEGVWHPAPGQGTFGAARDAERAAADFLAEKSAEPEPEE